jgi:hypothetical protein
MKQLCVYGMVAITSVVIATLNTGCATMESDHSTRQCGSDYSCLSQMAVKYRQQANQLSTLAQRYEVEAAAMTGEDAQQQHQRAQAYWSEAQQADALAQEYRRQLPHNMVQ